MRKLLILYGTTEGQTRKIAEHLADKARALDYTCELYDAATVPANINPSQFDRVIVAASVHAERHQPAVAEFVRWHLHALERTQSAFFSVSLSAAGDAEERYDAWEYTRRFLSDVDWHPAQVHIVAGALRFSEQNYFKRWAMRRLAKDRHADRKNDCEYTDWSELNLFLKDFLESAR
jgi:menaquinone-dependent protoporphyrinogen oxidase